MHAYLGHPPEWDPGAGRYAAAAIEAHPDRFAAYATLALDGPDGPDRLRRLHRTPGVLGLRFLCLEPRERTWPRDRTMDWMFALAEELGMPVALCGPTLMPVVAQVAERHPGLKLIVDHFGLIAYAEDGGLVQSPDVLRECVTMFTEHMTWLPEADLELITGTAYCERHRWAPGAPVRSR